MDLNRAQLIGNVTRDPESRTTGSGQTVTTFSVATNMQWTDTQGQKQTRPEYHNIVAWAKLGDICKQYLVRGKKIYIEGRLQTREWDGQDGQKRRTTEIVAENMIMLDRGGAPGSPSPALPQEPTLEPIPVPNSPTEDKGLGSQEIRLEDIPF